MTSPSASNIGATRHQREKQLTVKDNKKYQRITNNIGGNQERCGITKKQEESTCEGGKGAKLDLKGYKDVRTTGRFCNIFQF